MIGVIGLGRMGSGIAATLMRGGCRIVVRDLDPQRMAPLVEGGAVGAADVAEICGTCDTVLLSLPSSAVTVDVIEHQLAPAVRAGTTVIDMGTTVIRETRRLHALLAERDVELIDAPVSGGSTGAAQGELYVFAGGRKETVETKWDLLRILGGGRLTYCGESGCGQIAKAVNQLAMGLVDAAYIEAVAFGVNAGVDAETLREAVGGEGGFRRQFDAIAARIASGDGDGNDVKYAEHAYFLDEAHRAKFPVPMLDALYAYMSRFPVTMRDNMDRPYPPLWSALTGGAES